MATLLIVGYVGLALSVAVAVFGGIGLPDDLSGLSRTVPRGPRPFDNGILAEAAAMGLLR